jgi:hypothetical protein
MATSVLASSAMGQSIRISEDLSIADSTIFEIFSKLRFAWPSMPLSSQYFAIDTILNYPSDRSSACVSPMLPDSGSACLRDAHSSPFKIYVLNMLGPFVLQ